LPAAQGGFLRRGRLCSSKLCQVDKGKNAGEVTHDWRWPRPGGEASKLGRKFGREKSGLVSNSICQAALLESPCQTVHNNPKLTNQIEITHSRKGNEAFIPCYSIGHLRKIKHSLQFGHKQMQNAPLPTGNLSATPTLLTPTWDEATTIAIAGPRTPNTEPQPGTKEHGLKPLQNTVHCTHIDNDKYMGIIKSWNLFLCAYNGGLHPRATPPSSPMVPQRRISSGRAETETRTTQ